MNLENMNKLIDALQAPMPDGFTWDMRQYRSCACGLAGSIFGYTSSQYFFALGQVADTLGLTLDEATELFSPLRFTLTLKDIQPENVAQVLIDFRDTGEIIWKEKKT